MDDNFDPIAESYFAYIMDDESRKLLSRGGLYIKNNQYEDFVQHINGDMSQRLIAQLAYRCANEGRLNFLQILLPLINNVITKHYCLINAISSESMDIVDYLLTKEHLEVNMEKLRENPNYQFKSLYSLIRVPLETAILTGNVDFVRRILDAGAEIQNDNFDSLYVQISNFGTHSPVFDFLIASGANINHQTLDQKLFFIECNQADIDKLVCLGANINMIDKDGNNSIEIIVTDLVTQFNYFPIIKKKCDTIVGLIKNGCKITNREYYDYIKNILLKYSHVNIKNIITTDQLTFKNKYHKHKS